MLKKLTAIHFITLFSLATAPFYAVGSPEEKPETYYKKIVNRHLRSFGPPKERPINTILPAQSFTEKVKALFTPNPLTSPTFSEAELCQLAFNAQSNLFLPLPFNIMPLSVIDKSNLIEGTSDKGKAHLISYLFGKLLNTISGQTSAVTQLAHPTKNVDDLIKIQQIIAAISSNSKVMRQLTAVLKKLREDGEAAFYSYYDTKPLLDDKFLEKTYWQSSLVRSLNNSTPGLELGTQLSHLQQGVVFFSGEMGMLLGTLPAILIGAYAQQGFDKNLSFSQACSIQAQQEISNIRNLIQTYPKMAAGLYAFLTVISIPNRLTAFSDAKVSNNIRKLLQTQLIGTAAYINGAKELYKIISKNPEIAYNFPGLKALKALVKPSEKHSEEFNELVALLSTNTFIGEASCFSLNGRVLRAHKLMNNESVRREFAEIISAVGAIDVYTALAQQITATADQPVKYSFVTFDTQSTKPYIKGTGLWNPFVTQKKAVTNDIDCGFDLARNIVLSGPNTGGKSTFAKTVLLNAILAQTFGIVAAENVTMTPFSNLDCYMNMVDDIAGGISGLKAEVLRAKELLERIRNTNGFSFVLLDEIFTATSPDQAEKLAVEFISQLSQIDNVMFIDAAHFEGLIQFAQESASCRNCHMGAIVDETGRVTRYTYKISEGRSTVKNAAQVAEDSFLKF